VPRFSDVVDFLGDIGEAAMSFAVGNELSSSQLRGVQID
jgi:hypothetical protein